MNQLRNKLNVETPLMASLLAYCLMSAVYCNAQSYTFSFTTGNPYTTNLPGAISLNNGWTWDDEEYYIPIGFTFYVFDEPFDSIYISDFAKFKANGDYRINAFYADFIDRDTTNGGYYVTGIPDSTSVSPISYLLDGIPGNRILKIEWINAGFIFEVINKSTLDDRVNVQLWLYEGTNDFEVHIGPNAVISPGSSYDGNEGASVGLRSYTKDTIMLSGAADSPFATTQYPEYITGTPSSGVIYKFKNNLVGINQEESLTKQLNIYPNPGNGIFNVQCSMLNVQCSITIYNVLGEVVFQIPNTEYRLPITIDLSNQPGGIYFIRLQTDKEILTGKIISQ